MTAGTLDDRPRSTPARRTESVVQRMGARLVEDGTDDDVDVRVHGEDQGGLRQGDGRADMRMAGALGY